MNPMTVPADMMMVDADRATIIVKMDDQGSVVADWLELDCVCETCGGDEDSCDHCPDCIAGQRPFGIDVVGLCWCDHPPGEDETHEEGCPANRPNWVSHRVSVVPGSIAPVMQCELGGECETGLFAVEVLMGSPDV